MALKHLRTGTANKRPDPAIMAVGQLAVNYESGSPGLFFKDEAGALVKIGPVHIGATAPNSTPASGGTSGNSKSEFWLDIGVSPEQLKVWDGSAWVSTLPDDLPVSKLLAGTARQLLQTNADGDGVEWASNIDIPGTLDVTGNAIFDANLTVQGDLTVNGTETIINTQTLTVEDKNIELGKVTSPTDTTADGGGITLKGTTDKTINWVDATDSWTSSENVDLATGKSYKINNADVLTGSSLGSGVTSSSLTSVGTLTGGAIGTGFTTVATAQGGTGQTTYANGELLIGKTDGTLAKSTLTGGTGIDITNADGAVTVDVDSTVITTAQTGTVTSTMIKDGTIVNADINASAGIVDTKLATIATGGKVSNSATTATATNAASAIVARDGSGNFTAGTITAALTGNASTATALETARTIGGVSFDGTANINLPGVNTAGNQDTAGNAATATKLDSSRTFEVTGDVTGTVSSDLTSGASIATSIASGVIVDADINASAAIAGTKISPNFGSQNVVTTGTSTAASLIPTGSTAPTNGIYLPAANSVGISTNGTQQIIVDEIGNTTVEGILTGDGGLRGPTTTDQGTYYAGEIVLPLEIEQNDILLLCKARAPNTLFRGELVLNRSFATITTNTSSTRLVLDYAVASNDSRRANYQIQRNDSNLRMRLVQFRMDGVEYIGLQNTSSALGSPIRFGHGRFTGLRTDEPLAFTKVELTDLDAYDGTPDPSGFIYSGLSINDPTIDFYTVDTTWDGHYWLWNDAHVLTRRNAVGPITNYASGTLHLEPGIIEQGTNANGRFVKYADGTQHAFMYGVETRTASGVNTTAITHPVTFVDAAVTSTAGGSMLYSAQGTLDSSVPLTATNITLSTHTTTGMNVQINRSNSTNTAFFLFIIGRWY